MGAGLYFLTVILLVMGGHLAEGLVKHRRTVMAVWLALAMIEVAAGSVHIAAGALSRAPI